MSEHDHLPEPRRSHAIEIAEWEAFIAKIEARIKEKEKQLAELENLKSAKEHERDLIRARIDELNERANKRTNKALVISLVIFGALLTELVRALIGWI